MPNIGDFLAKANEKNEEIEREKKSILLLEKRAHAQWKSLEMT